MHIMNTQAHTHTFFNTMVDLSVSEFLSIHIQTEQLPFQICQFMENGINSPVPTVVPQDRSVCHGLVILLIAAQD